MLDLIAPYVTKTLDEIRYEYPGLKLKERKMMPEQPKKLCDLAELVQQMRNAQKTYFRERTPQTLSYSRELERRVDKAVDVVLNGQGKLFDL